MARAGMRGAVVAALVATGVLTTGCEQVDRRAQAQRVADERAAVAEANTVEGAGVTPRPGAAAARARRASEERARPRVRADEPHAAGGALRDPMLER